MRAVFSYIFRKSLLVAEGEEYLGYLMPTLFPNATLPENLTTATATYSEETISLSEETTSLFPEGITALPEVTSSTLPEVTSLPPDVPLPEEAFQDEYTSSSVSFESILLLKYASIPVEVR